MATIPISKHARLRVKALYAGALLALCSACGGDSATAGSGTGTIPATPPRTPGITLLAGDVAATGSIDGKGAAARFSSPRGIAIDGAGNLYVADQRNYTIRKVAADGQVSTFAGTAGASGQVDGRGSAALFVEPTAIAIDGAGNLFVTDYLALRKITPAGDVSTVTTIATGDNLDSRVTHLFTPAGIAVDKAGNLFVTNGIGTRRISPALQTTMLEGVATMDNVFGTRMLVPRGVAVDAGGNLYVADLTATVSRAAASANSLARFVGSAGQTGSADGSNGAARFEQVVALSADQDGNVYAADAVNNLLRKITPNAAVTTVAGTARANALQTGPLPGSLANLGGVVADGKGNLYATSGNAVVKITLP